ncbi:thermonuclease family protein [uncultured Thiodictyon sp.]|uniref:thermonuclease family protein n=1 Tax=uncultured Thiodictyon sp. TaxID=1846217 RepID=UPI0025E82B6B|nr:thermonuclease family protein [uncultured Thiodictyon sp.]
MVLTLVGAQGASTPWAKESPADTPPLSCTLVRVFDGDSLELRCNGRTLEVRLYCIDAPEWEQDPWGKRSLRHLEAIAPHRVELEPLDTDRFGRIVGKVYGTGPGRPLLNLQQVASGQAAVYRHYCKDPGFDRAEQAARQARLGIWSRPGEQQTPWAFRHRNER